MWYKIRGGEVATDEETVPKLYVKIMFKFQRNVFVRHICRNPKNEKVLIRDFDQYLVNQPTTQVKQGNVH